jgi:hypothetical protein
MPSLHIGPSPARWPAVISTPLRKVSCSLCAPLRPPPNPPRGSAIVPPYSIRLSAGSSSVFCVTVWLCRRRRTLDKPYHVARAQVLVDHAALVWRHAGQHHVIGHGLLTAHWNSADTHCGRHHRGTPHRGDSGGRRGSQRGEAGGSNIDASIGLSEARERGWPCVVGACII